MSDRGLFLLVLGLLGCLALGRISDYFKGEQELRRAQQAPARCPDMAAVTP